MGERPEINLEEILANRRRELAAEAARQMIHDNIERERAEQEEQKRLNAIYEREQILKQKTNPIRSMARETVSYFVANNIPTDITLVGKYLGESLFRRKFEKIPVWALRYEEYTATYYTGREDTQAVEYTAIKGFGLGRTAEIYLLLGSTTEPRGSLFDNQALVAGASHSLLPEMREKLNDDQIRQMELKDPFREWQRCLADGIIGHTE